MPEREKMDGAAIGEDATLSGTIDSPNIHLSINFIKSIAIDGVVVVKKYTKTSGSPADNKIKNSHLSRK